MEVESIIARALRDLEGIAVSGPLHIEGHGSDIANEVLKRGIAIRDVVQASIVSAKELAALERNRLERSRQEFVDALSEARARYLAAIDEGGDQEELERDRDRLSAELRELERERELLEQRAELQDELLKRRAVMLKKLDDDSNELFCRRRQKYEELTLQSGEKLRLHIEPAADRMRFSDRLDELSTGTNLRKSYMGQIVQSTTPAEFVDSVLARDSKRIASWCDMRDDQASDLVAFLLSHRNRQNLLSLSYDYDAEDKPRIEYRKPDGVYAEIARLSVGQKCSALVMIALADQNRTVVIDQPEDSLDVVSVFDDVVHTLRAAKDTRQFVVTTHNPNVAVTSDSDMFYLVDADADRGWIEEAGPMDLEQRRGRVMRQLEGGREPYELRRRKYEG